MSSSPPDTSRSTAPLLPVRSWLEQLRGAAASVEASYAEQPLSTAIQEASEGGCEALRVLFIALDPVAEARLGAWMGAEGSGGACEFTAASDRAAPLLGFVACRSGALRGSDRVWLCRLDEASAPRHRAPLAHTSLLVVAGGDASRALPTDLVHELGAVAAVHAGVVTVRVGEGRSAPWQDALRSVPAWIAAIDTPEAPPNSDDQDGVRLLELLRAVTPAIRTSELARSTQERVERERERVRARRTMVEREGGDNDDRARDDRTKLEVDDIRTMIEARLKDVQRALVSPADEPQDGSLGARFAAELERLSPDDFEILDDPKSLQLVLRATRLEALGDIARTHQRERLVARLQSSERAMLAVANEAHRRLAALGLDVPAQLDPPPTDTLRARVDAELQLAPKFRGQLPKRTWQSRLSEGQRAVMGAGFLLMLLGSFGISRQAPWVAALLVVLLVAGIAWGVRQGRRTDTETLARETERARDAIREDTRRRAADLERFVQTSLSGWCGDAFQGMKRRLDTALRDRQAHTRHTTEASRDELRNRLKRLERTERELEDALQRTQRVGREAEDALRELRRTSGSPPNSRASR